MSLLINIEFIKRINIINMLNQPLLCSQWLNDDKDKTISEVYRTFTDGTVTPHRMYKLNIKMYSNF